ncbi:hypothetical protein NIIDMKKI_33260 [Mycobacterium kansasii]|uniref:Uncharacterized protein n=1 Tax=Mycobacterium kansasii TaxID=1768 RepID=A0A7G1IBA3_MYCKA|nr:hypothetical protein NIIDMKKI_33260 [Mycobacterium kansasii]
MIDSALNLGGAFTNCTLTRTVRIDEDNEVDLTGLSITAGDDGALHVQVKITKSGFCYSATGTVGAKITIAVAGGQLVVQVQADDPNVDVDIPWYCWVAGAVIGALLGALLPSVIYVIVGAVLVPLIMYIAEEVIEGTINSVAAHITDALNQLLVPVDIPAVGFNIVFSDARIDDVQIGCRIRPIDTAPVRAAGTVVVPNGSAFDLDSGRVGARDMPSGDLTVLGGAFDRTVRAVCGARWARTGLRDFDGLYRAAVYGYAYDAPNPIPLADLATIDPFGLLFGNPFRESLRIYGVRTNEGRWAAVQAVDVTVDHIRFRYITWEKALASVQIVGGFTCPPSVFGTFGRSPSRARRFSRPRRHCASAQSGRNVIPATSCVRRLMPWPRLPCRQGRRHRERRHSRVTSHRSAHRYLRRNRGAADASAGPIRRCRNGFRPGTSGQVATRRHRARGGQRSSRPGRRSDRALPDRRDHPVADRAGRQARRDAAIGDRRRRRGARGLGRAVCALRAAMRQPRPPDAGMARLPHGLGDELRRRRGPGPAPGHRLTSRYDAGSCSSAPR